MGKFGGDNVKNLFLNKLKTSTPEFKSLSSLKVSSHFFVRRTGRIIQFVSTTKRAWHAGISSFDGVEDCNNFSIGIELEGTEDSEFTDQQYNSLMEITKLLLLNYPNLSKEKIVGHSEIAPNRKTDPGKLFNWKRYLKNV